jgi:WD40 repeat protein
MLASQATTSQVNEVAVNPHGDVAAAALADGGTLVWQWKARHVRSLVSTVGALAASFSPDGTLLAVGYTDGETRLWDWAAREVIASFRPIGSRPTDNPEGVADVEVTPRGPAVVASVDGRAFVYGCPACAPLAALLADSALAARRLDRSERNRYRQLVGD